MKTRRAKWLARRAQLRRRGAEDPLLDLAVGIFKISPHFHARFAPFCITNLSSMWRRETRMRDRKLEESAWPNHASGLAHRVIGAAHVHQAPRCDRVINRP